MKRISALLGLLALTNLVSAQSREADSSQVAKTLQKLLFHCRTVQQAEPGAVNYGPHPNAAPYMVYRAEANSARRWKDFMDYTHPDESKMVDETVEKINKSVNEDAHYIVTSYYTKQWQEGTWHNLVVSYRTKDGKKHQATFGFLSINGRYALSGIDWSEKG